MSARDVIYQHLYNMVGLWTPDSQADACLAALHAAGYAVVPVAATHEMAEAGAVAFTCRSDPPSHTKWGAVSAYRAMLAASEKATP